MKSSELGLSAMYRILKKAGAERVSDESADELRRRRCKVGLQTI
jgi:histone H3/H4